ncbi:glycogen debranching protein [Salinactinospora qingdaonensis]|uniref:Glycogen debranching protein GlgX n=1 Tax=Salinactinospora qingdaonensis TaxID=702744 RepID=A0ABP7G336_9ACTN
MTKTPARDTAPLAPTLRTAPGEPTRLGAHAVPGGMSFAVAAAPGARLSLVLLDPDDGSVVEELPFPEEYRVGNVHTMRVFGLAPERTHYGYRVRTDHDGSTVPPILLDPYAKALAGTGPWGHRPRYRSAVLAADFDWGDTPRPRIPTEDLVIYELHVRGFTRDSSSETVAPGTFAGLREKIPYLNRLGVNCVELLPVFEFDETDNTYTSPMTGAPLLNFWGYNTVSFFAPKAAYAVGSSAARELKEIVRALHNAGIEVILDVVFNHTAEGDHRGPTLSFRGLDNDAYYLLTPEGQYRNLTATGNTVNANHPLTRSFILDCLRYWASEFHIDGFRFDMAPILARDSTGELMDNPPLLEAIAHDPVLADCKLIAEATDATGLDQVGSFPSYKRWMEWNGRYRDALRRFLIGRSGAANDAAARLVGSPDLYPDRGPTASVNYIACHDGFTLADWASYDRPHNDDNGENGEDGIAVNDSWNCGAEGPSDDPTVLRLRRQQVRNALLLLLFSNGVPMLLAGDEFGRTQWGNNNAYGQDNAISWIDWDLAEQNRGLLRFVQRCLGFRRAHPVLRRRTPTSGETPEGWPYPPVSWHGRRPWEPDWSPESGLLAPLFHQQLPAGPSDTVFIAANARSAPTEIHPPSAPAGTHWHLFADTGAPDGSDAHAVGSEPLVDTSVPLRLTGHSTVALVAHPAERGHTP